MTSTIPIAAIVEASRQAEQQAELAQQQAAERRAEAETARRQADELEASVAEATKPQWTNPAVEALYALMRSLTNEVAQARGAAVEAVRTGGEPALEAWLRYRRLRAHNKGTWQAVSSEHWRLTHRPPPPGNWGPDLLPAEYGNLAAETFEQFVTGVLDRVEREIHDAALVTVTTQLREAEAA
jgi:multidrug efflux pump subunit AcrA (membrane-fusion protein)